MKRVIFLILALQILLVSVCNAFEPPTDKRWIWLGSTDECGMWLDTDSMQYSISDTYDHRNHKQVDSWILVYNVNNNIHSKQAVTYDLTCKQHKLNNIIIYDDNNKVLDSTSYPYANFNSVAPETFGELILQTCQIAWDTDPRNNLR